MALTLTAMPERFAAGTTLNYSRTYPDYAPGDGWSIKLYLAGPSASSNVQATPSGGFWLFAVDAVSTGALVPGIYRWLERATKGSEVVDVNSGLVTVSVNIAQATAGQLLSWEEQTLPLVEAAIAKRIPSGMESYQIAGRALSMMPLKELEMWRNRLKAKIAAMKNGGRIGRQHLFEFRRAGR